LIAVASTLIVAATGCTTLEDLFGIDGGDIPYEFSTLSNEEIATNIANADASYREPRDADRVSKSLELSLASVSPENDYEALWRAVRAAAWLAQYSESREDRVAFGERGIQLGKAATELESLAKRPESHYFLALAMANYCDVIGTCAPEVIVEIRDRTLEAHRLDPQFDHCGPSRFVGELIVQTADYPAYNVGDFEEGLEHLQRAAKDCPKFAENWLLLGLALLDDGDDEGAQAALEKVLERGAPPDHTAEYKGWVVRAKDGLDEL